MIPPAVPVAASAAPYVAQGAKDVAKDPMSWQGGLALATGGMSVLSGIGGALGGLFGGGGGGSEQGMTLPPSLEFRMLNDMYTQFEQMKQDYSRISNTATAYEKKFNTLAQGIEANLPPEEMRRELARSTAELAQGLGMPIAEAMKQGFLTDMDMEDINKLKELETAEFRDPGYDKDRADQRQQLVQNLQRQGVSGQQLSQALASFDNETTIGAFNVAEQLRGSRSALISNRIGMRQGLQQQNFGFGQQALGAQLGALGQYTQIAGAAGQMYGQGMQTFATGLGLQSALRGEQRDAYSTIGQYKFSKDAKNYMKTDPYSTGQFQSYAGWQAGRTADKNSGKSTYQSLYAQNYNMDAAERSRVTGAPLATYGNPSSGADYSISVPEAVRNRLNTIRRS